jgi:ADP-ribose pyrophosphatase
MAEPTRDEHLTEVELESEQAYKGRLLDVRCDRVRLPDGGESTREYVKHPGAAVVIPVLENGKLLFERQYRYPLHAAFLELPAGKIDAGEDAFTTAERELFEETGHRASDWRRLGVMHPSIAYSTEGIEIFIAWGVRHEAAQQLDHGEFLDLLELSLDDAIAAIRAGEITDAKTITALFWAEKVLRSGW